MKKVLFFTLAILLLSSCAQQKNYNYGWTKFFEKDYENADILFRRLLEKNPNDPVNLKGLGITLIMLKKYPEAQNYLEQAFAITKDDAELLMHLGVVHEAQQRYDLALDYYTKFLDKSDNSSLKSDVEKLITNVKKTIYKSQAAALLSDENKLTDKDITKGTVAIVTFQNRGEKGDYDALQKGIPQMMITDFGYVPKVSLLERMRIEELLKEMKLSESNIIEKNTAQRLGKLLKAENLITGSFSVSPQRTVRLDAIVINVPSGQFSEIIEKEGTVEDFFSVQKELSLSALDKMKVSLTDEQRKRIRTLPTESFFEFLAALKKKMAEEEELTFQGPEFISTYIADIEIPVNQVSDITVTTPEIKPNVNPVETPLPRPPNHP